MPKPDLADRRRGWIYAGGAHHTGFSQAVTTEMLEDFAEMAGIELVVIDGDTKVRQFKQELRWNEVCLRTEAGLQGLTLNLLPGTNENGCSAFHRSFIRLRSHRGGTRRYAHSPS